MPKSFKPLITLFLNFLGTRIANICQFKSQYSGICGRINLDDNFLSFLNKYWAFFLRRLVILSTFLICSRAIAAKISDNTKLLPTLIHEYFFLSPLIYEDRLV